MKAEALTLVARGVQLCDRGEFNMAISAFEAASLLDPHDADIWNNLGWTWGLRGNPDAAIRSFDRAVLEDPQHTMAWVNKGIVLKNLGQFEPALACYRTALAIINSDSEDLKRAWHNMAVLFFERGGPPSDVDQAARCVAEALRLDPHYDVAHRLSIAIDVRRAAMLDPQAKGNPPLHTKSSTKRAGSRFTTPRLPFKHESRFRELLKTTEPAYLVPVVTRDDSKEYRCFQDVGAQVREGGGKVVLGWIVWEWPGVMAEVHVHAVWRSPEGALVHVSRTPNGESDIVFIPDARLRIPVAPLAPPPPTRIPLGNHPKIRELIDACEEEDRERPGQIVLLGSGMVLGLEAAEKKWKLLREVRDLEDHGLLKVGAM